MFTAFRTKEFIMVWRGTNNSLREDWFDGDDNLGHEITTELSHYGEEGWEVVASMQWSFGTTHKIILKRLRAIA
jgi:hypothetical protein